MTTTAAAAAPLPQPSVLIEVLTRVTDPAVPGTDKLPLIETPTDADAAALDRFTRALTDNQLTPLEISAREVAAVDDEPGLVVADVTITPASPDAEPFAFPMQFRFSDGRWQLSRQTADMLLAYQG
jgi:hypothetical protein